MRLLGGRSADRVGLKLPPKDGTSLVIQLWLCTRQIGFYTNNASTATRSSVRSEYHPCEYRLRVRIYLLQRPSHSAMCVRASYSRRNHWCSMWQIYIHAPYVAAVKIYVE